MRKNYLVLTLAFITLLSCNKGGNNQEAEDVGGDDFKATSRICAADDVLQEQLAADPSLKTKMNEIEKFTQKFKDNPAAMNRLLSTGIIEIPVVFNVLYRTAAENVTQAQLQSQIDVLNADFAAANADYNKTSTYNEVKAGNINVQFVISSVVRRSTTKSTWSTNNAMKKSAQGIAPTDPVNKLNIWVCNMGGGILGYAQFPGGSSATDGVVLDNNATGNTGTAEAPFGLGRTATHEVGHWMNLRHIWGDALCGSDLVNDTPTHNTSNGGCPSVGHLSTCSGTPVEMTMNYMDYTYDECMYMFSAGQKTRMLATFAAGGPRSVFAQP